MARAMGRSLPVSLKQTAEVCNFIRSKNISNAKEILKGVAEKRTVVPFKRFNADLGHKKRSGAGRFPVKVSKELIKLLEAAEANAQFKGLNTSNLTITHICAHNGSKTWHFGRKRRRQMKRTNVEVIVEEKARKESKEPKNIQSKKEIKKTEKAENKKADEEKK